VAARAKCSFHAMIDENANLDDLRREVGQIRFVMIMLLCVALAFFTLINLAALTAVPRFERIFEEMLGSRDKLPMLTKLVVNFSRLGGGLVPYALTALIPAMAMLGLVLGARTRVMPVLCLLVMLFLVISWVVVTTSMFLPLITIIEGVGERTN
jgi:hypothetical protein